MHLSEVNTVLDWILLGVMFASVVLVVYCVIQIVRNVAELRKINREGL